MSIATLVTFILYFAVVLAVGWYCCRKNENIEDYLLGGRRMGALVTAISAEASGMSGWLLMGLPGAIYLGGAKNTGRADMGRIAVDIVLLPDEVMTSQAIEINRRLVTSNRPQIVLNHKDCLPHISLAMGCIEETDVTVIQERLAALARKASLGQLRVVGMVASVNSRGEMTSLLGIDRTEELQALHEQVMQEMSPFFRQEVSEDMLYDDVVSGSTLDWIRTYPQNAAYEHFCPHITLGYGQAPAGLSFPIPFRAARLALCHLGNHCTCRRILAAIELGTPGRG